jgi:hypothetical protein
VLVRRAPGSRTQQVGGSESASLYLDMDWTRTLPTSGRRAETFVEPGPAPSEGVASRSWLSPISKPPRNEVEGKQTHDFESPLEPPLESPVNLALGREAEPIADGTHARLCGSRLRPSVRLWTPTTHRSLRPGVATPPSSAPALVEDFDPVGRTLPATRCSPLNFTKGCGLGIIRCQERDW